MADNSSKNKRIAKNTIFLYIRMIVVLLVGLYTSRVVLNVLGVEDYGVYNVVGGFVSLFAFLNATLSASLQRFYNYEGSCKGENGYTNVYSLGIRVHAILAISVLAILETFGIWYINNVMVLPEGRLSAAHYLFQFSITSMLMVIMKIPFSAIIIAKEKMNFYAVVSIIEALLRLGIALILPFVNGDKLIIYGLLYLGVSTFDFILNVVYAKTNFKFLHLLKNIDKSLLKEILSFSGWNLFGTVIFMLKGQGVNLLLNAFFGTVVNAARGVAFQVNSAIMGFSSNISISFRPQLISSYAEGNKNRAFNLFMSQSKICYCLVLMLITPVIIEINPILHLWLGSAVPEYTDIFTALVLIDAMICTLNAPVTQIVHATGNIKLYQILSSVVNIFLLPICWLFLYMGYDAWTVFLITIIVSIINQSVCLIAMHQVFRYDYKEYLRYIILPCLVLTIIVPIIPYVISHYMNESIWRIILVGVSSIVITVTLLYVFFLTNSEKNLVKKYVSKIKKNNK